MIFPNPNAPTGLYEDLADVEDIIAHNQDVIVIVDEAYVDFAGCSALELIDKYENLIIVQTFSKARSMAGMRIGYAISNPTLIKYLNDDKIFFSTSWYRKKWRIGCRSGRDKRLRRIVSCGAVLCQTVYCGKCSAQLFYAQTEVGSAVIRLERHEHPPVEVRDEKLMFRVIRASFNQRRKTLANGLKNSP